MTTNPSNRSISESTDAYIRRLAETETERNDFRLLSIFFLKSMGGSVVLDGQEMLDINDAKWKIEWFQDDMHRVHVKLVEEE